MSPIEIRPTTLPSSTTGRCRNFPSVIFSMMPLTVSASPATHDLARHHRADRLVEHGSAALAEHAHDVALGQNAFDACRRLITSTAPIRRSRSILIAAESFASGSTL